MAQFDVYRLTSTGALVVDCQTDLLDHIGTRFVAPLVPLDQAPPPTRWLNPTFAIEGADYVMLTQSAAAVRRRDLGPVVASLSGQDRDIMNALDFLLTGV